MKKPYALPSSIGNAGGGLQEPPAPAPGFFFRTHQQQLYDITQEIKAGVPINTIYAAVTPGGGKSLLPVLLCELIPQIAERICWVTPRKSLQYQGEQEFVDWKSRHRVRVADNTLDPCRGLNGYITTYQAIAANPGLHIEEFKNHLYILFLDEPHHVKDQGEWYQAIAPLLSLVTLVIYASGTFARGDGEKIGFLNYRGALLDIRNTRTSRVIRYTRFDALKEGAICPVHFRVIDGQAEWIQDGEQQKAVTLLDKGEALFTALRTEYAEHLLMRCYEDWLQHTTIFPAAKMLIVAPNIALARQYHAYMKKCTKLDVLIATSDDSLEAQENIARFKNKKLPCTDILITVAMAYEGLSVKQITHVACLTHIRSIPWLEQCFARGNRTYPEKQYGVIYLPADSRMIEAIQAIEQEQELALQEKRESKGDAGEDEERAGGKRDTIQPLSSQAHFIPELTGMLPGMAGNDPIANMAPSVIESVLKEQIRARIKLYLEKQRPGNRQSTKRLLYLKIKKLNPKSIDQMNRAELETVLGFVIKNFPV